MNLKVRGSKPPTDQEGAEMATTARDVMTQGVECAGENETVADAATKLADLDVDVVEAISAAR